MNQYEFLGYQPTPGEKHLGIATVKLWGKIVLRWKIIPNKDGSGFFSGCASYKMPDPSGGNGDFYAECFMLETRTDHQQVTDFIRAHVKRFLQAQQPSVFGQQATNATQPVPSYPAQQIAPQQPQNVANSNYWDSPPDSGATEQLPF